MRIRRLILENFGQFRGRTEIDLAPRDKYRKTRPVILIGGTNGAGKTTILEAIRLCLYGSLALGVRVSHDEYHSYLRSCIHRSDGLLIKPQSAAVALDFEFSLEGRLQRYFVERSWDCKGATITTNLTLTRDGFPIDELEQAHADEFLRDLIPYGVSQLYFFDGEKIQQMAQATNDDATLADAVRELLGLDLLTRLRSDLSIYSSRHLQSNSADSVKQEIQDLEKRIDSHQEKLLTYTRASDQCQSNEDRIRDELGQYEKRISRSGGSFGREREGLRSEAVQLESLIEEIEAEIRESCSELLPFTLASQLCMSVKDHIEAEDKLLDWQTHVSLLRNRLNQMQSSIEESLFADSDIEKFPSTLRKKVVGRVNAILDDLCVLPSDLPRVQLLHAFSRETSKHLTQAIDRILTEVPKRIKQLESQIEQRMRRLSQVKSALEKIPEDDAIEPFVKHVNELNRQLGMAQSATKKANEELSGLEHELVVMKRLKTKKEAELKQSLVGGERLALVTRVQNVVDEFSKELTKSKISDLSAMVGDCFAQLWRKGDVLHEIKIDPETCSVILLDKHSRVIPKERLSAGEKQMYAISLLWALAKVSGRVLPMIVDTPLARLDSKHRHHLVTRYFPHASHQVVILSTDTEIDQTYFRDLSSSISHAYHLRFDDDESKTVLEEGYFWSQREKEIHA